MDPRLRELIEEGDGAEEVEIILKLRSNDVVPPYVRIVTRFGDIVTCRVRRDRIRKTWEHKGVLSVKAPRLLAHEPELFEDDATSDTENRLSDSRRPQALEATGCGVIVGVIDWGLDFAHPNFRKDNGSTRLLALWDQDNTTAIVKPAPYDYGIVYSQNEINRALKSPQPYEALGYHPADSDPLDYGSHGTHVSDIAVGNGRVKGSPIGIAPEADIVFVQLATHGIGAQANLGNTVRVLEALDFIAKVAGDRSWVVNLSLGRCGGPHTGLTLVEQGMDALLLQAPGRAIVQSTGNYFNERVHAAGQLHPGRKRTLTWWIDKADFTPNELEVWYPMRDMLTIELRPPGSNAAFRVPLGEQRSIQIGGQEVGCIYHRAHDPSNGDNHINVFLYLAAPPGPWQVTLIGEDIVDGRFHCWVERDNACRHCQSRFDPKDAVSSSTTGTIASGFYTIAVGAYNPHSPDLELGIFSSSGPTRDGREKPNLIAPGVRILAARSASRDQYAGAPMLTRKSGTSMAAPHVTGTIACMFQAARWPLWIHETRKLLLSNCRNVLVPPEVAARIGDGYLDIEKAVDTARKFTETDTLSVGNKASTFFVPSEIIRETNGELNREGRISKEAVMNREDEDLREELGDKFFEEENEGSRKRNFIIISGGPGLFHPKDKEHDQSWSSYVDPPLLKSSGTKGKIIKFWAKDEQVYWLVYRPAYEARWKDDEKNKRKSVKDVKDQGFNSYVEVLEDRAQKRGWMMHWLSEADDLWSHLMEFKKHSISRVWYYGHARDDLWLFLEHSDSGTAIKPASTAVIKVDDIKKNSSLRDKFEKGEATQDSDRTHRFVGCNTALFAEAWASTFKVWAEGFQGKVQFTGTHTNPDHEPDLVTSCVLQRYSPTGVETESTEAWQPEVEVAETENRWAEKPNNELLEIVLRAQLQEEEKEESPLVGRYAVIIGSRDGALKVRDQLAKLAQTFWNRNDLKWAFPYVYAQVTNEVVNYYDQSSFKNGDVVLHWIANFYELYALNLKSWIESGKAESPWETAFTEPDKLRKDLPWGARSAAAFILGMFAHIKSDLPRAVAYVFLKFYEGKMNPATKTKWAYNDFKADFDIMNDAVFPKVIEKVAEDGVVLPSVTSIWPGIRDWYLNKRLQLSQLREEAWKVGEVYATDAQVVRNAATLGTRTTITVVSLEKLDKEAYLDIEMIGARLVDLADEVISAEEVSYSSGALLSQVLSKAGISETFSPLGSGGSGFSLPTRIFDIFTLGGRPTLRYNFEQIFEVVALPGTKINQNLRPGDMLIRRALGEGNLAHSAILATGKVFNAEDLTSVGLTSEGSYGGLYAQVVDAGPFPHKIQDRFARRLASESGKLGYDQMILRFRPEAIDWVKTLPTMSSIFPTTMPSIKLKVGQKNRFILEREGVGGFSWSYSIEGSPEIVNVSTERLSGPPSTWSDIGGGLPLLVTITALAQGRVKVHFAYSQPWVKDIPPEKKIILEVSIQDGAGQVSSNQATTVLPRRDDKAESGTDSACCQQTSKYLRDQNAFYRVSEHAFRTPNETGDEGGSEERPSECPRKEILRVGRVSVWRVPKQTNIPPVDSAFFFESGMAIDADGSPRAYHPDSRKGLDNLGNAGKPGNWWGLVTDNGERDGTPIIQGTDDPAPGYYISTTALRDRRRQRTDPQRYVNSEEFPYIVLPAEVMRHTGTKLGDFAIVINRNNGKLSSAIFADVGPKDKLGEGSIALAEALRIPSNPRRGGTDSEVIYLVFPGSGDRTLKSIEEINKQGNRLFNTWGGMNQIEICFPR